MMTAITSRFTSKVSKMFVRKALSSITIVAMVLSSAPLTLLPQVAEAVTPVTIFSDGFESGDYSTWTSGTPDVGQWNTNNSANGGSHGGIKASESKGSTSSSLVEEVSTSGYADLEFSFWYQMDGLDDGDSMTVEWYDGSSWNTAVTFDGADGDGDDVDSWTQYSASLPTEASNEPDFAIRFTASLNHATDNFYIDDVLLSAGTEIPACDDTDTVALTTFDTFSLGDVDGQNSWSSTGSYDQEVVENIYGFEEFGCQSLRISNAVTTGAFGDQTFAAPVVPAAGETGIATNNHFEAQFDFASTMLSEQEGLALSVSPDDGNGSRMSYLSFVDESDGVHVTFYDVTNPGPLPTATVWNGTEIAVLDRETSHTIKFVMDFVDGPGNDVVEIYINGVLEITGTSWEDYYRYDVEQNGNGNILFPVDTLIFRAGGTAAPATDGNGYLFDNLSLSSSENIYQPTGQIITPTPDEIVSGSYEFTATYDDGDENNDDAVQWAVREGTCAAGTNTVFGNVDGHSDSYDWDGASFSSTLDLSSLTPGEYCFIFNPTDDPGQNNVRETQTFFVESPLTEVHVAIMKYVDGELATEGSFPMHAQWSAENIGSGSGNYSLTGTGYSTTTPYTAVTAAMDLGADYSTYEVTGGDIANIGEECPTEGYRLVGYRWGETLSEAEAAEVSYDYPELTDLQTDIYIIVDNETCICEVEAWETIYSDSSTQVNGGDSYEINPHPAWTASIPGASWIWSEDIDASSESASVSTETFTQVFNIDGTPLGATLKIATDNTYSVWVNGHHIADSTADLNHFQAVETVNIPAWALLPGENELRIDVDNPEWDGTNPAGLLYSLMVGTNECEIPQVKVHILKYLYDGETTTIAEASTTDSASFPMQSSWSSSNTGSGTGNYTLNPSGYATSTAYAADTTAMNWPADYSTYEETYPTNLSSNVLPIGATCAAGWYRLEGYKTGNTIAEAEAASLSTTAPSFTDLQQDAYVIVVNRDCDTVPTATVTMCKYDTNEVALSGWTLILKGTWLEDLVVNANDSDGTDTSNILVSGVSYIATALGNWLNNGVKTADAEYVVDGDYTAGTWPSYMDGPAAPYPFRLDLQINEGFVDWGPFNAGHIYSNAFTGGNDPANFRVFEGANSTAQTLSWYNDNTGSLDVSISEGYAGVTDETGCVVFENVPYGTYTMGEVPQIGWSNISGDGESVEVNEAEEWFSLVNKDDSILEDSEAHLKIVKYTEEEDGTFEFSILDEEENATTTELTTIEGSAMSSTYDLEPGEYSITETEQDGWDLVDAYCEYTSEEETTPDYEVDENGVSVALEAGDYVTCYFENEVGITTSSEYITVHRGDLAENLADVISDVTKWFFYNDETDTIDITLGAFTGGPSVAPLGNGSAMISVTGTERRNLATYQFAGIPFSEITEMQFSTYNPSAGNGGSANRSAYINFNVDFDGSDTWQKRIAFVPNQNGSVVQDSWQTWNAVDSGAGLWWWSGFAGNGNEWPDGDTDEYRTWSDLISSFPDIRTRVSDPWLGMRVGEPYSDGYTENLDRFLITINDGSNATTTIFDFEPDVSTITEITNAVDLSTNPSLVGQPYTVQWDVSPTSGTSTPTGTVAVTVNGGAGCSDDAIVGECSITPTETGTVTLQANFSGDPGYDDSSSEITDHEIVDEEEDESEESSSSSSGGGGGNGPVSTFFSFGGSVLGASTSADSGSNDDGTFGQSCGTYVTQFLGYGMSNNSEQVLRLQYVLSVIEGFAVPQDGIFGISTLNAVNAFQLRYASEILAPWGLTSPTGYVYLTTRKKINELYCQGNQEFPLTPEELALVQAGGSQDTSSSSSTGGGSSSSSSSSGGSSSSSSSSSSGGSSSDSDSESSDQVGAAAESEGGNIFGNFFNWLFGWGN